MAAPVDGDSRLSRSVKRSLLVSVPLVALALLVTLLVPAGRGPIPAADAATTWRPTPGVKFNVPREGAKQYILEKQIIAAINHARRDSTIRMVMFSFDRNEVTDALLRARRDRRVAVQVIVNGHELPRAQKRLKRALGMDRSRRSFFYQCKASCRGQGDVQHSKFVLFSQAGAAKKTVMLGSLNMKLNGVKNQFNDLLTINFAGGLYDALDNVFTEMRRDRPAKRQHLRLAIGDKYLLEVMPFPKSPLATRATRYTVERDPINRILAPVRCTGANTASGRTVIRVNMHAWDRERGVMLAKRFRALYAAGCDVRILVGFMGKSVRQVFGSPTKRGLVPVRSTGFDTDDDGEIDLYSHEKILLINGRYGAATGRRVVVTGSSNYQNGGQYGDELILRVIDGSLHSRYTSNWNTVWGSPKYSHGFILARPIVNGRAVPMLYDGLGTDSPEWRDK